MSSTVSARTVLFGLPRTTKAFPAQLLTTSKTHSSESVVTGIARILVLIGSNKSTMIKIWSTKAVSRSPSALTNTKLWQATQGSQTLHFKRARERTYKIFSTSGTRKFTRTLNASTEIAKST